MPLVTKVSAIRLISVSFRSLHPKVFHEFQPIGGVAPRALAPAAPPDPPPLVPPRPPVDPPAPPVPLAPAPPPVPPPPPRPADRRRRRGPPRCQRRHHPPCPYQPRRPYPSRRSSHPHSRHGQSFRLTRWHRPSRQRRRSPLLRPSRHDRPFPPRRSCPPSRYCRRCRSSHREPTTRRPFRRWSCFRRIPRRRHRLTARKQTESSSIARRRCRRGRCTERRTGREWIPSMQFVATSPNL